MIHLRSLTLEKSFSRSADFPFNVPIIKSVSHIEFDADVTFLVGDNGSGKSTLLEAIACAVGSTTVGSISVERDPTLADVRRLSQHFKLTWTKRTRNGFFMRAEDFFGYAKEQAATRADLEEDLKRVDEEYKDRSITAQQYAKMAYQSQVSDMQNRYGEGLDTVSHGEGFLKLFQSRFVPNGLYLLDEPEAPLSPLRQLSFLTLMAESIKHGAQFIIATHSPIIMAYPNATILSFDDNEIKQADYDTLEHVTITRNFLSDPQAYLRHLLSDE